MEKYSASRSLLVLIILVLLPIDWFSPSGGLLREAGAKPINVFFLVSYGFLFLAGKRILNARAKLPLQVIFATIICIGTIAFLATVVMLPPQPSKGRSPYSQFVFQAGMMLLFMIEIQVMVYFFGDDRRRQLVLKLLPAAALIHLGFFLLETLQISSGSSSGMFTLFRSDGRFIERASGLMSEPSYYGTFAALYAFPLLLLGGARPIFNRLLAAVLLISAYLVQAKTMFIILIVQMMYMILFRKNEKKIRRILLAGLLLVAPFGFFLSQETAVLDVGENLSTVMRVGSNILAWRASVDGYGIIGAGIGQFHFLYTPKYAPDFLMISREALDQLYGVSDTRASTYNLPLRLLVETGILGLAVFFALIIAAALKTRHSVDSATIVGMCFVAGSFGFLMTQDTYCLPSLAFGLALALTEPRTSCGRGCA